MNGARMQESPGRSSSTIDDCPAMSRHFAWSA
jgi:hypothetical protein